MATMQVQIIELSNDRHVMYGEHEGSHYFRFRNTKGVETKFKLSEEAKDALVQLLTGPRDVSRWILTLDATEAAMKWKSLAADNGEAVDSVS